MNNLNKALAISLLYKYGMFGKRAEDDSVYQTPKEKLKTTKSDLMPKAVVKKADEDEVNIRQHASGGAGIGSLLGGGLGVGMNLKKKDREIAKAPAEVLVDEVKPVGENPADLSELMGRVGQVEARNNTIKDVANAQKGGTVSRLKMLIKQKGIKKALGGTALTGLLAGVGGAALGAGAGAGVGYIRKRINQRKKVK